MNQNIRAKSRRSSRKSQSWITLVVSTFILKYFILCLALFVIYMCHAAVCSGKGSGKECVLQAVLLLLGELGKEELTKVQRKVNDLLQ